MLKRYIDNKRLKEVSCISYVYGVQCDGCTPESFFLSDKKKIEMKNEKKICCVAQG